MQDIRLYFIGDSFVNGTGDPEKLGWCGRVAARSESDQHQITFYNLGIRAQTSQNVLGRWEREVKERFVEDADSRLVFSFGVNDIVMFGGVQRVSFEESVINLDTLLESAKKEYEKILMIGPPPIDDETANSRIKKLNDLYSEVCQKHKIDYLSVFEQLSDEPVWRAETASNDGAHPRDRGYTIFADIVYDWDKWWFK